MGRELTRIKFEHKHFPQGLGRFDVVGTIGVESLDSAGHMRYEPSEDVPQDKTVQLGIERGYWREGSAIQRVLAAR